MISTMGKKRVNLQGFPYMPPNLVNFGPETAENGWRVFTHPINFRIGRQCQPYPWTLYKRQQANLGTKWHELTVYNNRLPGELTLGFAMHLVSFFSLDYHVVSDSKPSTLIALYLPYLFLKYI